MMSGAVIRQLSREAALKARRARKEPMIAEQEDIDDLKKGVIGKFNIPNLGDYRPKGWKLIETHFVDKSGFGREGEPALTQKQFFNIMVAGHGYAMIEEGEFQCYVGEFEKE